MGNIESLPTGRLLAEESACDITQPAKADRQLDAELASFRSTWHAFARYRIMLSREGDWNDKTVIAEWLRHDEAKRICEKMDNDLVARNPAVKSHWTRPAYSIALHEPLVIRSNIAAVGDLLLHEVLASREARTLTDAVIFRQFFVPAVVTQVSQSGRITAYQDRTGSHTQVPKHPHVVSATAIDVDAVLLSILDAEKVRGHWAGEFSNAKGIQPVLVRCQRIHAPVYPIDFEVARTVR